MLRALRLKTALWRKANRISQTLYTFVFAHVYGRVASGEKGLLMSQKEMNKMEKAKPGQGGLKDQVKVKKKKGAGCVVS